MLLFESKINDILYGIFYMREGPPCVVESISLIACWLWFCTLLRVHACREVSKIINKMWCFLIKLFSITCFFLSF